MPLMKEPWRSVFLMALVYFATNAVLFVQVSLSSVFVRAHLGDSWASLPPGGNALIGSLVTLSGALAAGYGRVGKRATFAACFALAACGAAAQVIGAWYVEPALVIVGAAVQGVSWAAGQACRFAAVDIAPPDAKARAVSITVLGGVFAVLGPEVGRLTVSLIAERPFVGSFATVALLQCVGLCAVLAAELDADAEADAIAGTGADADAAGGKAPPSAGGSPARGGDGSGDAGGAVEMVGVAMGAAPTGGLAAVSPSDAAVPTATETAAAASAATDAVAGTKAQAQAQVAVPVADGVRGGGNGQGNGDVPGNGGTGDVGASATARTGGSPVRVWSWSAVGGLLATVLSFVSMAGLMQTSSLAIVGAGFGRDEAVWVVEAHVTCMYLPSLYSGRLVELVGAQVVIVCGAVLLVVGAVIPALQAEAPQLWGFFLALSLVGVGWNFAFVGGSVCVSAVEVPTAADKARVRATVDGISMISTGGVVLASGGIFGALATDAWWVYGGMSALLLLLSLAYLLLATPGVPPRVALGSAAPWSPLADAATAGGGAGAGAGGAGAGAGAGVGGDAARAAAPTGGGNE